MELLIDGPSGPGVNRNDYVLSLNGEKLVHKQHLCKQIINLNYIHKSFDRQKRVRGLRNIPIKEEGDYDSAVIKNTSDEISDLDSSKSMFHLSRWCAQTKFRPLLSYAVRPHHKVDLYRKLSDVLRSSLQNPTSKYPVRFYF